MATVGIPPSLLLLILDVHPTSWSILSSGSRTAKELEGSATISRAPVQSLGLAEFLNTLMIWLNAHLAARWGNEVVVFAAGAGTARQVYPSGLAGPSNLRSNVYQPFNMLDLELERALKSVEQEEQHLNDPPSIVSALTKALCFINRVIPQDSAESEVANTPDRLQPRIMIINATPSPTGEGEDGGSQRGGYVGMMNCVFAAQKGKVPIDVLTLPPEGGAPIFLQQAAHLTEGIYWRWNGRVGLLQYLHVSVG
ncbi:TFIIH subunit Tfb4/p34 [Kockovaella imperatae]|uniref:General transcription and DNA repair factor IIH subunit TFB4 n=1 Tax=Kockovaella imperatae TaxID=4999 RepID=A0A1Y1USE4_9TREE|nr:TFIIH subunit Tfb4/p34 [Kockovaella imperatae]ORX40919.1 TFIIH subunit Tfb4/p34 [Kockovaella imperatae]